VAHLSEGTLRRMFDDPDTMVEQDRNHFATCPVCKRRYDALAADAQQAVGLLALPAATFDADSAWKHVSTSPVAEPRFGIRLPIIRPASRAMIAALAAVVALAVVVTASVDALQIFKPTTVTPVPITKAELQSLPDLSAYGTISWSVKPQPQIVTDQAAAEKVAGFAAPRVGTLPSTISTTVTYAAMPAATGVFTFSAAKAEAAAAAKGQTLPPMPAGMDGSTLTLTMGPALVIIYGNLSQGSDSTQLNLPQLIVAESATPVVTSNGVTVAQLEDYLLKQPGISPQLAADIRAIGDPTVTLPIPVPVDLATSSKTTIQGVDAVAVGDNTGLGSGVIWIKSDHVFFVGGTLALSQIEGIANGLS
jgi:hypothetical protein